MKVRDGDCIWEICEEAIGPMTDARRMDDRGESLRKLCLDGLLLRCQNS